MEEILIQKELNTRLGIMYNDQAISRISSLSPFERYQHFIKRIADFEEYWLLENDNKDIAFASVDEKILLPIWSAREFTIGCQQGVWVDYHPKVYSLEDLETSFLQKVDDLNALIDVFPVGGKSGFVVSNEEFVRDLNEELRKYE